MADVVFVTVLHGCGNLDHHPGHGLEVGRREQHSFGRMSFAARGRRRRTGRCRDVRLGLLARLHQRADQFADRRRVQRGDRRGLARLQLFEDFVQRDAVDEFHRAVLDRTFLTGIVDGHDVGLVQLRHHLLLAFEPLFRHRVGEPVANDFERDPAVEVVLAGFVDLAHAASIDEADDVEWPESLPRLQGMTLRSLWSCPRDHRLDRRHLADFGGETRVVLDVLFEHPGSIFGGRGAVIAEEPQDQFLGRRRRDIEFIHGRLSPVRRFQWSFSFRKARMWRTVAAFSEMPRSSPISRKLRSS